MRCRAVPVAGKDAGRLLALCWGQFDGILSWRSVRAEPGTRAAADAPREPRRAGCAPGSGCPTGPCPRWPRRAVPRSPPCPPCSAAPMASRGPLRARREGHPPGARGESRWGGQAGAVGMHQPCRLLCLPGGPWPPTPVCPGAFYQVAEHEKCRAASPEAVAATSGVLGRRRSLLPLQLRVRRLSVQPPGKTHGLRGRCCCPQRGACLCWGGGSRGGSGVALAALPLCERGGRDTARHGTARRGTAASRVLSSCPASPCPAPRCSLSSPRLINYKSTATKSRAP